MAGIYAHIPFCHSKCAYCDFYSMPNASKMELLADALVREYQLRRNEISEPVRTIYLGGGTPSIVPPPLLQRLAKAFPADGIEEFTIEANPEDATFENASAWRKMGINRVSMGVQSLCDAELQAIGRRHDSRQAVEAVAAIKKAGFSNFSLDLIYGLPRQTVQSFRESLLRLLELQPTHFSAYMLSYEHGTRLTAMLKRGLIQETSEDDLLAMYEALTTEARNAGYLHYEISNFALPGFEAKHNSSYWDGTSYLGLGPSAHSYDGAIRRVNPADLKGYLAKIDSGILAFEIDAETPDNAFNDMVMTALRTSKGIDLSLVPQDRLPQLLKDAQPHIKRGALIMDKERLYFSEKDWLISDAVISDLFQV